MSTIVRALLGWLGYRVEYVSEYGTHNRRYDGIDRQMGRPIHPDMSVAPPWAKRRIVKDDTASGRAQRTNNEDEG